jgi:hypothetical protein
VDGSLWNCTNLEQRAVLRLLWAEEVKPTDIHWRIVAHYGGVNCVNQRSVFEL